MPDTTTMNTFVNPASDTYLLKQLFILPTETGGKRAIAVTVTEFAYLSSAYALIVSVIFGFVWQIVIYLVLLFYPTEGLLWMKGQLDKDGVHPDPNASPKDRGEVLLEVRKRKSNRYVALIAVWNASNPWIAMIQLLQHTFSMCF